MTVNACLPLELWQTAALCAGGLGSRPAPSAPLAWPETPHAFASDLDADPGRSGLGEPLAGATSHVSSRATAVWTERCLRDWRRSPAGRAAPWARFLRGVDVRPFAVMNCGCE